MKNTAERPKKNQGPAWKLCYGLLEKFVLFFPKADFFAVPKTGRKNGLKRGNIKLPRILKCALFFTGERP